MSSTTYPQTRPQRKLVGLGAVVILHLLLLWALQTGLIQEQLPAVPRIVQAILLDTPQQAPRTAPTPPPAPATPKTATAPTPPTPSPPKAEAPAALAPSSQAITVAPPNAAAAPATPAATPPKTGPVTRTAASVNSAHCEKPEYPAASRRMEEEGHVTLRFLVGVDGRVLESVIEKTSGYKRLDEAARASLAKCQFKPATVDGKPEQGWATLRYTWRLE